MTTLQRLIASTHSAVFDKAPGAELALRVRHTDGAVWSIADEVLTVRAGAAVPVTFNLALYTVAGLAAALVSAGFQVPAVSSSWAARPALALIEGDGDQAVTNGDHLTAFTSLLWAIMSGYGGEVRAAEYQVGQALRQMVITQAEGEWLDIWGTLYGVDRKQTELDAALQIRLRREVFRRRVNAHAIEIAIMDETGWDVRIEEPWRELFRLDESTLSGGYKFYDGDTVGYHLIRPEALDQVDWSIVLPIIERNKPAGVIVVGQRIKPTRVHQARVTYTSQPWRGSRRTWASAHDTWRGLNPVVDVKHTSASATLWAGQEVVWGADDVAFGDEPGPAPILWSGDSVLFGPDFVFFGA